MASSRCQQVDVDHQLVVQPGLWAKGRRSSPSELPHNMVAAFQGQASWKSQTEASEVTPHPLHNTLLRHLHKPTWVQGEGTSSLPLEKMVVTTFGKHSLHSACIYHPAWQGSVGWSLIVFPPVQRTENSPVLLTWFQKKCFQKGFDNGRPACLP